MLSNKKQNGFTVVETLIVIAVTGMMFMSTSLLIRGKVARTSYQDSMRQLQQIVQNTINDVENGYMASSSGNSQTELLLGKRILFCADGYTGPVVDCQGSNGNGNILHSATITQSTVGSGELSFSDVDNIPLPGGLKFKYFTDINGNIGLNEFGSRVMFGDSLNKIGRDAQGLNTVKLYHRQGATPVDPANNILSSKFILCFQGYKNGSLEVGTIESGTNVTLNIEDPRCTP